MSEAQRLEHEFRAEVVNVLQFQKQRHDQLADHLLEVSKIVRAMSEELAEQREMIRLLMQSKRADRQAMN